MEERDEKAQSVGHMKRDSKGESRGYRPVAVAAIVLLVVSVTVNVVLAYKVQLIQNVQANRTSQHLLKVGAAVPPIEATRLDGTTETINYLTSQRATVLYIFTPPCGWCARNIDNFKTLLAKENGQYRFIGLSLSEEGLAQYVANNELKMPVYSSLGPEALKTYKLGITPQTIVISHDGKVLQDWVGAYVGDQKSQVEAFFHVSLPGLREISKAEGTKQNEVQPQAVN